MNLILLSEFSPDNDNCNGDAGSALNCSYVIQANEARESHIGFYVCMLVLLFVGFRSLAALLLVRRTREFF